MNGHWFCSNCEDVVHLPPPVGRWDARRGVLCPTCRHETAEWVPDQPRVLDAATVTELFQRMKDSAK